MTDLQPWLNVDIKAIEEKVQWLVSRHHHIHLVHGELIDRYYMNLSVALSSSLPRLMLFDYNSGYLEGVAKEVAALLMEEGTLLISDVVNRYGLPTKFVLDVTLLNHHASGLSRKPSMFSTLFRSTPTLFVVN